MSRILAKSIAVTVLALLASLAISFTFVPMLGGEVSGAGLVMTIVCPIAVALPASTLHYWQSERLRRANGALMAANDKLAEAYRQLHSQSRLDALTGVLNRHAFAQELQAVSEAAASGGLLFINLDHFKSINDRFGHATGDEALRAIGQLLTGHVRATDIVGRLGGEEFGIFLHSVTAEHMLDRSHRIREAVRGLDFRTPAGAQVALGASIGAFHCPAGFDPSQALAAADGNLYRAKSTGRNTVIA